MTTAVPSAPDAPALHLDRVDAATPLGLYVHVPFCATRCGYCDFNTYTPGELGSSSSPASWLEAVRTELRLAAAAMRPARPVSTVFVGGGTPSLRTTLDGDAPVGGEHSHHGGAAAAPTGAANPATFDAVLAIAQRINVTTGQVEITPPAAPGKAWVVQEIQRSFPTEVDAVAIDGSTMQVTDRVDFADFPLLAKLSRWGIDIHMGSMFGLANQLVLFVLALGIASLVVLGYAMWWRRRPTRGFAAAPARGVLRGAPWWGIVLVFLGAIGLGLLLPFVGYTLAGFVVLDVVLGLAQRRSVPNG